MFQIKRKHKFNGLCFLKLKKTANFFKFLRNFGFVNIFGLEFRNKISSYFFFCNFDLKNMLKIQMISQNFKT